MRVGMLATNNPENVIQSAVNAIGTASDWRAVLDEIPLPIYVTDALGAVIYWNGPAAEFAGREPRAGRDRWCVTWQLYTTAGSALPHDQCPMAQAIREKKPVRDAIAIAERPDGTRAAFRPYPTPLFDEEGTLTGAINMLIDVTDEQSSALMEQAQRCRRLAEATYDRATSKALADMANGFDRAAGELSR